MMKTNFILVATAIIMVISLVTVNAANGKCVRKNSCFFQTKIFIVYPNQNRNPSKKKENKK